MIEKSLSYAHLLAALLLPAAIAILFSGCLESEPFLNIEMGPKYDIAELENALSASGNEQNPAAMKVGQFVHTEEVNDIANGAAKGVIADTGQTLIKRDESADQILFTVIETRIEYMDRGNYRSASTEKQYQYIKPAVATRNPSPTIPWYHQAYRKFLAIFNLDRVSIDWSTAQAEISEDARLGAYRFVWPTEEPLKLVRSLLSAPVVPPSVKSQAKITDITFHRFKNTTDVWPAPSLVKRRANCAGLPNCQMRVRNIEFDQIIHRGDTLDRIHFEFVTSSDVPYFATNLRKCVTLMVPMSSGIQTLLKQCANVVDFRFESDPQ